MISSGMGQDSGRGITLQKWRFVIAKAALGQMWQKVGVDIGGGTVDGGAYGA